MQNSPNEAPSTPAQAIVEAAESANRIQWGRMAAALIASLAIVGGALLAEAFL
ncbi:hypothetical protein P2318_34150 [Myxococcaceae bacterium GXIMD 01537]